MEDIHFWESVLERKEAEFRELPEGVRELAYWRDVVPYKYLVRVVRLKAGRPVCWAAVDCLTYPNLSHFDMRQRQT